MMQHPASRASSFLRYLDDYESCWPGPVTAKPNMEVSGRLELAKHGTDSLDAEVKMEQTQDKPFSEQERQHA